MAITAQEIGRTLNQNKSSDANAQTPPPERRYQRSAFVDGQTELKKGKDNRIDVTRNPDYFAVSEKLEANSEQFLTDYTTKLFDLQNSTDAYLLQDPRFKYASSILSEIGVNSDATPEAKSEAFNRFLKTQRGLVLTDLARQEMANMILLRNHATARVDAGPTKLGDATDTIVDAGPLRRLATSTTARRYRAAVGAVGGAFGVMYGPKVGIAAAGIAAVSLPPAIGAYRVAEKVRDWSVREGVKLNPDRNSLTAKSALQEIQSDPEQFKFFEAMTKGEVGEAAINRAKGYLQDSFNLRQQAGLPPTELRTAEQFLLDSDSIQDPQGGAGIDREVQDEFLRILKNKGVEDQWGQKPDNDYYLRNDATGGPPALKSEVKFSNFDASLLSGPSAIVDFYQARRNVIMNRVHESAITKAKSDKGLDRDSRTIGEHMQKMGVGGDLLKQARQKEQDKIDQVEKDIEFVGKVATTETQYQEAFPAIREVEAQFAREFSGDPDVETAIQRRQTRLDSAAAGSIPVDLAALPTWERTEFGTRWPPIEQALTIRTPPASPNEIRIQMDKVIEEISRQSGLREQQLRQESTKLTTELTTLNDMKLKLKQNQEPLQDGQEIPSKLTEVLTQMDTDFYDLTVTWGVSDVHLARGDIDALMRQINTLHRTTAAHGWARGGNGNPDNRARLMRAIIEAKAQTYEAADPMRTPARTINYGIITGHGISENQLRVLSIGQLRTELTTLLGTPPVDNVIKDAMDEARSRFITRERATRELNEQLGKKKTTLETTRDKITLEEEVANRTLAKKIIDSVINPDPANDNKTLYERAIGEWNEKQRELVAPTPITAAEGYTPEELRPTDKEKGYYEFLQFLTGYQNESNRQEAFKVASRVIPRERLARAFYEGLNLGAGTTPDLTTVFTIVNTRLHHGQMTALEMFPVMKKLVDELRTEYRSAVI